MKTIVSLSLSSVALLMAACGGSGTSGGGAEELTGDAGSAGAAMGGEGGEPGSGEGARSGGGSAGDPGSGGTGAGQASGGSPNGGGSASGGSAAAGGSAGSSGGSAGSAADDAGVAGSGGASGAGGGDADAGADAAPLLVAPPPAGVVAYAYASDKSQVNFYEPSPGYAFNQGGGTITIHRTGVGVYTVEAQGLTAPIHNVQVTAYRQAAYCRLGNVWTTGAFVWCHDADGAPVDAQFSFLALGPAASTASITGYAWTNMVYAAQYTPDAAYEYNAGAGAVTARRTAVGTYSIEFAGLDLATGNVQVRSQGTPDHCNVYSWLDANVEVRCYDDLGALADAKYNVLVTQNNVAASSVVLGYAQSVAPDDPGGDITETPGVYKFNSAGGSITATRSGVGSYRVRFEGVNLEGSNIQVTALGAGSSYCNAGWPIADELTVFCRDANGDYVDSQFMVAAIK